MIHYLDDLRHALAVMWTYQAWAGNISAGAIVSTAVSLAWPRLRHLIRDFLHGVVHKAATAAIEPHVAALHDHIEQATGVKHDPDRAAS